MSSGNSKDESSTSTGYLSYVGKMFLKRSRYFGGPKQQLRRLYADFLDACVLVHVDTNNLPTMLRLMKTVFLTGQARIYFAENVLGNVKYIGEAVNRLQDHFLDPRAKKVNDEVWEQLSFEFLKKKRVFEKQSSTHEVVLEDVINQISELMRRGPADESVIYAKLFLQ